MNCVAPCERRMNKFAHELANFKDLVESTAMSEGIDDPSLVEKDYWIMHVLYGLQSLKFDFQLKGGTSLSKGYGIIQRFSEDIDIRIEPNESLVGFKVYSGKNHDDERQRDSRKKYFDWISAHLIGKIHGVIDVTRDEAFDDPKKYRNGGIRLYYPSVFRLPAGLKEGILLEVGFDNVSPNLPKTITSWAYEKANAGSKIELIDNRALSVQCYEPQFTFVEKLQAISRKYRLYKEGKNGKMLPENFLRHYYDIYQLLNLPEVQAFIETPQYQKYKKERFKSDSSDVRNSQAFLLHDPLERALFEKEYTRTSSLYFRGQPAFNEILLRIQNTLSRL